MQIGKYIAGMIEDGSTLQIGIGTILMRYLNPYTIKISVCIPKCSAMVLLTWWKEYYQ
jgi:hypothetical protein